MKHRLGLVLSDPGADVLVITNMWPDEERPVYGVFVQRQVESLRAAGVKCDVLYLRGYRSLLAYPVAALQLAVGTFRWRGRYRLVHVHAGETSLAARFLLGPPMLVSYCGDDILGDPREDGSIPSGRRARSALVRAASVLFPRTITKSRQMHDRLPHPTRRRNTVIPNGVDTELFKVEPREAARLRIGWASDELVVLFAATRPDSPRKRRALAEASVARSAELLGRSVRLCVAGSVPPSEMPTLMNACDCLLLTSSVEGSPNVIKEALMCNLPVVATAVGDVAELLEGVVPSAVCPADAEVLADALADVLRFGRRSNGRTVAARVDSRVAADRVLEIYCELGLTTTTREEAPSAERLRMRVAQAGIRGVPANFGGSETAVQEIGKRLASHGDQVVVYCRRHKSPDRAAKYLGMERVILPSIPTFHLDTISHSFVSSLDMLARNRADIVHFHGMGNALCLPLFRLSRKKVVITIDGPDWERPKWGPWAKRALKLSARLAVRWADHLIIDNHPSIEYFKREFGFDSGTYIPYGADREKPSGEAYVRSLGLEPRGYILFVGALVPDKGADTLIEAYRRVRTGMPLVVVGDSPFAATYREALRAAAGRDPRVRMLGYVYDDRYRELLAHAYAYAHPLRSDGTSPALLQAMGYGSCIVVNSLPEALSAVGDAAVPFALNDVSDLAAKLQQVIDDPTFAEGLRCRALARAETEYDWDRVAAQHREVYENVLSGAG